MGTRIPIIRRGDTICPANQEALDAIRRLPQEKELAADLIQLRNVALHKKAFAYIKLAFQYWEPKSFLMQVEIDTVKRMHEYLVNSGLKRETSKALCTDFLAQTNIGRKFDDMQKNIESFREEMTIDAGFYTLELTPAGPKKKAKSWAYVNMAEDEFQELFSSIRRVCWERILSQTFKTIEEADDVAAKLMEFD